MEVILQPSPREATQLAARAIARRIREHPRSVLGLPTGGTPLEVYREWVRLHREDSLVCSGITTFNLDEYIGLPPTHPQSYHFYMRQNLFQHLDIPPEQIHLPDGMAADIPAACADYERRIREAGGIDLQFLGIGVDGHLAFNEPGSSLASRTRIKTLTDQTLRQNARYFDDPAGMPRHVITMGLGTLMESRCCLLLALGESKADAVAAAVEGPLCANVPASLLQMHPRVIVIVDEGAAGKLKRADYYRWVYDHKPDWQRWD